MGYSASMRFCAARFKSYQGSHAPAAIRPHLLILSQARIPASNIPMFSAGQLDALFVKSRTAAHLADLAEALLGKLLGAGFAAHPGKFCDCQMLPHATITCR